MSTFATPITQASAALRTAVAQHIERATAPLTAKDFCDRCHVARAVARVTVKTSALYLCGHHLHEHQSALDENPDVIVHVEPVSA